MSIKNSICAISILLMIQCATTGFSQSIVERKVDEDGDIYIKTTMDTIATGERACVVSGLIYNSDSVSYFANTLIFKINKPLYLSSDDKIEFYIKTGEVIEKTILNNHEFYPEGSVVRFSVYMEENDLIKITNNGIASISLINKRFNHLIPIEKPFVETYQQLANLMLSTDVYDSRVSVGIK